MFIWYKAKLDLLKLSMRICLYKSKAKKCICKVFTVNQLKGNLKSNGCKGRVLFRKFRLYPSPAISVKLLYQCH
jgi:hypothetical protein